MTVYAKIENNKLITAYNGYNGVTGLADSIELCLANGFTAYTEEQINGYFSGAYKIIDDVLINISDTDEYKKQIAKCRETNFNSKFFDIPSYGWYRRQPKGYASAPESLNAAFNFVVSLGQLPSGVLTFYTCPDFTNEAQCSEEWLVANSFKNTQMTKEEFFVFYQAAIAKWNQQEH